MRRVAGGHRAARAIRPDTALDRLRVGVTHVEASGRYTKRFAENLREDSLEPRPHRRRAGIDDERSVPARFDLRCLERSKSGLLDVDRETDAAAHCSRTRIDRRLVRSRFPVI